MSTTESPVDLSKLTLDPSIYNPSAEDVEFLKGQTGIQDDEGLKAHVLAVQKEAWEVRSLLLPQGVQLKIRANRSSRICAFAHLRFSCT